MSANKYLYQFCFITTVSICNAIISQPIYSQVRSDTSLSTKVNTLDNSNFTITGGSKVGNNLFHSFKEFSVPTGGSASFDNLQGINNIINRVTGGSISNIQGSIQAQGNANFFLLNPNGIVFGPNAQLNIQGSFLATTANSIKFAEGPSFSANETQSQPLLNINTPTGLQFGANVKPIVNQAQVGGNGFGLQVKPNRTLALVGGDITLENGAMYAPGGRIELGSVDDNSFISLTPVGDASIGWRLGYENVQEFRDILLSKAPTESYFLPSIVTTDTDTNKTFGQIYFRGKNITITDTSIVSSLSLGTAQRGIIDIQASEFLEVSKSSQLFSNANLNSPELTGSSGDIKLETQRLLISNGAFIDASSFSAGRGGNVTINAPESVELRGGGLLTQIATQALGEGNAGEVKVTTGKLIISDGGQIASSTFSAGDGGSVIVNANQLVEISGQAEQPLTGLLAGTRELATGNGGIIKIDTGRLTIQNGGTVSVEATDNSTGQAGTLDINAVNSVEVSGRGSSLRASSNSPKPAGNLTITTDQLLVQDGAEVSVSSTNIGNAGNLEIVARTVSLDNEGKLTATSPSVTGGGNISLQRLNSLTLRRGSEISTSAQGEGNGGDITISTNLLTALENSNIKTTAERGRGGKITITTQGIFISPDSLIDAASEQGIDGVVEIDRLENNPENALLTLPAEPVNISGLIAQGCSSGAGSIARRGSEFVVTGRGGLPPTPKEAFRGDVALVDLGKPIQTETTQAQVVAPTNQKPLESTPLVEAQGWVIGSEGEVMLTASASNVTPSIPWMQSNSCHG
ncbi:two-partner secretion domain-containing protein [Aliterella atlantica]|uniref:Filamentous haemagglutinin FhaB/tRNA nuclease CdiA-like TPS domain-containing protein n=1 Tax=Aliterella atlantica CENA595 TaxID=1618023 RepID=A0A0D8ZTJ8_9CYAN|nr:filamentous hemagglutinin N-terminal domain-containing protein [Aliterella atlantica]KJH71784.1 hypothetical protein UH38_10360 [Aliterella atlantica CENA595]